MKPKIIDFNAINAIEIDLDWGTFIENIIVIIIQKLMQNYK